MPAPLLNCNSTIACAKGIQDVQLEEMGCSVGEYNMNALELEDKKCVFARVRRGSKTSMRTRKEAEEGHKEKKERQGRTSCG